MKKATSKTSSLASAQKMLATVVLTLCLLSATSANAQQQQPKFGYVAAQQIIFVLPEARQVDSLLRQFKLDSIDGVLPYLVSEYKRKDSVAKIEKNGTIKKQVEREAEQLRYQLENWNQIAQNRIQEKQNELLAPLYRKVADAIADIAKAEKYTYIFNAESLLHAPEGDNISEKILKKLGIKIPVDAQK